MNLWALLGNKRADLFFTPHIYVECFGYCPAQRSHSIHVSSIYDYDMCTKMHTYMLKTHTSGHTQKFIVTFIHHSKKLEMTLNDISRQQIN